MATAVKTPYFDAAGKYVPDVQSITVSIFSVLHALFVGIESAQSYAKTPADEGWKGWVHIEMADAAQRGLVELARRSELSDDWTPESLHVHALLSSIVLHCEALIHGTPGRLEDEATRYSGIAALDDLITMGMAISEKLSAEEV